MQQVTSRIIGAAIEVHQALGPGLLESAYEECLAHEMRLRGLSFLRQVSLPVTYKGVELDCAYRLDFLVNDTVVIELKSVEALLPIHTAQVLTYLKLGNWNLGLLINFNVTLLKNGLRRLVFNYDESSVPSASLR
jgi:GxxExxY protein